MKSNGSGSIINITTPGGKATAGGSQPTSLSRAAGISLTKAWSKEYAAQNIRVNTVSPGFVETDMLATVPADLLAGIKDEIPLGRFGYPDEVALAVLYPVSYTHLTLPTKA